MTKPIIGRKLPKRYAHYLFALIQSGLTTAVATAITSLRLATDDLLISWLNSWLVSWATMVPVVLLAAPIIRQATLFLASAND
jgi:hypothetical protein